jgi:uncharacterized protein (TIGR03503 family)
MRITENGDHDLRPLRDDGMTPDTTASDGIFSVSLDDLLRPGPQELQITVEGATFQRELRYSIHLYPAGVETTMEEDAGTRSILVRPVTEVIDPGSLAMTATITNPEGKAQPLTLTRRQDYTWFARLPTKEGHYTIIFQARGRTPQGRQLSFIPTPVTFENAAIAPVLPPSTPRVIKAPSPPTSWTTVGIILVIINALIAVAIWFGRRWWRQRNEAMFLDLAEQIEPPSIPL